jgi:hypothetical protein
MKRIGVDFLALAAMFCATVVSGKLPPPSDEAKAKAAETAAKTVHTDKVAAYQLCKSMDKVAAQYFASARKAGTQRPAAVATPPCADPGPFVYKPAAPATAAAAVTAAAKK